LNLPVSSGSETPKCYSIKTFCLLNQHVRLCVSAQDAGPTYGMTFAEWFFKAFAAEKFAPAG